MSDVIFLNYIHPMNPYHLSQQLSWKKCNRKERNILIPNHITCTSIARNSPVDLRSDAGSIVLPNKDRSIVISDFLLSVQNFYFRPKYFVVMLEMKHNDVFLYHVHL